MGDPRWLEDVQAWCPARVEAAPLIYAGRGEPTPCVVLELFETDDATEPRRFLLPAVHASHLARDIVEAAKAVCDPAEPPPGVTWTYREPSGGTAR